MSKPELTDAELTFIEAREEAATKPKWRVVRALVDYPLGKPSNEPKYRCLQLDRDGYSTSPILKADAEFIAAARQDVPRLCATVRRLQAELAPFQPMSSDEAEAAMDAIEAIDEPKTYGMAPDELEHALKYATDDLYRANYLWHRYTAMHAIARGLRAENERLRALVAAR